MRNFKKTAIFLATALVLILFVRYMIPVAEDISFFLDEYEEFDTYVKINESPLVYEVSKDGKKIGFIGIEEQKGYQSAIKMAVLIRNDGEIENVKIVDHDETPSFFLRITNSVFLNQFKDKDIADGFKIEENINAVSKATISSNAITKAIHNSSTYIGEKYLDTKVDNVYSGKINFGAVDLAILMMFVLAFFANKFNNKKLRVLVLVYSIFILGFKFATFVTYSSFFQIATGNFPSFSENLRWFLLVIGSILLVLLHGKNMYCTYICPFGALQELEQKVAKVPFKISADVRKKLSLIPYILSYLSLVLVLTTEQIGALSYEPFGLLFGGAGIGIQWILVFTVLFFGLGFLRPYCTFICPVGFVFNQIAKLKRLGVKLWPKKELPKTISQ